MYLERIVVCRQDLDRNCLADEGEILIPAAANQTSDVKLRRGDHFFLGVRSAKHSLYGWVAPAPEGITRANLLKMLQESRASECFGIDDSAKRNQIDLLLSSIKRLKIGDPVVCDFKEKSFKDPTRVLTVHKVFLRGRGRK